MRLFSNALVFTIRYRLPVIAFCVLIYWQSSHPGLIRQPLFPHADKLMHFVAYAFLSLLAYRDIAMEKPEWPIPKILFIAIFFSCFYGLSDEIHQAFVPGRTASFGDFAADCLGSICGCMLYHRVSKPT
jgi:VanZ family protein